MKWKDEFSVGIAEIDQQHKGFVDLFVMVDNAIGNGERWSEVFFKLEQLREHARFHFAVEESLLRIHHFPGLEAHIEMHRHFMSKLDQLQMTTLSRQVTMDTIHYLRDWYAEHMRVADQEYVRYIAGSVQPSQDRSA
jgi:hemerythrin